MFIPCIICNRHVHSHSRKLKCTICKEYLHASCIDHSIELLQSASDNLNYFCQHCLQCNLPFYHLDNDADFISATTGSVSAEMSLTATNLLFDVIDLNSIDHENPLSGFDPDASYYNDIDKNSLLTSKYLSADEFNIECKNTSEEHRNISLLHLNVRSLKKNFSSLQYYLQTLDLSFDIIGLTETWLNHDSVDSFKPAGYRTEHSYRSSKSGGGVSLLISKNLKYKRRDNLSFISDDCECVFVELFNSDLRKSGLLVGSLYRAPNSNISAFNDQFSTILSAIKRESKNCYLMGDFNINLLNSDSHISTGEFVERLYSFDFFPLITKPTRVTNSSATLIDNIFSNFLPDRNGKSGILLTDISDHFPIYYIDQAPHILRANSVSRKRLFTTSNINKFRQAINNHDWDHISRNTIAENAFAELHSDYKSLYDQHFPIKTSSSVYKNRCLWLTAGLKTSIKTKNRLYLLSLKYPTLTNKSRYKDYKSHLRSLLRSCEREYYDKCFAMNRNNIQKSWSLIKSIINKHKTNHLPDSFSIDGDHTTDQHAIANAFNNYFLNIGKNLASKIPVVHVDIKAYMGTPNPHSMFVRLTDSSELISIINSLKATCPGWDDISGEIVKQSMSDPTVPECIDAHSEFVSITRCISQ